MSEEAPTVNGDSEYDWRPAFEMALDEARRSIDQQKVDLSNIRDRAGNLIGYGGVLAGLTGLTLQDASGASRWLLIAALVGFLLAADAAVFVLWPRTVNFDLRASRIDDWFDQQPNGVEHFLQSAAAAHDADYAANRPMLNQLHMAYLWGVVGLAAQALLTMLAVVVGLAS